MAFSALPRTTLTRIEQAANAWHLSVFGVVHTDLPPGVQSLVLLGPHEPGFWAAVTASAEFSDALPDPLDRWSLRAVGSLATDLRAQAFFPFGGPPYQPFTRWARASGRAHLSPVGLLVHDRAGLMVSYRGALGLDVPIGAPDPGPHPCETCARPCLDACPVSALRADGYDVAGCKRDLDRPGNDCLSKGCKVRRTCPLSQSHGRLEAQSAFHMRTFK